RSRDAAEAREAMELVLLLPPGPSRTLWLKTARSAKDRGVRKVAGAWVRPSTLGAALEVDEPYVRSLLLSLAADLPDGISRLAAALTDPEPEVREAAAAVAARVRAAALRSALEVAASDDRPGVRLRAYGALLGIAKRGPS